MIVQHNLVWRYELGDRCKVKSRIKDTPLFKFLQILVQRMKNWFNPAKTLARLAIVFKSKVCAINNQYQYIKTCRFDFVVTHFHCILLAAAGRTKQRQWKFKKSILFNLVRETTTSLFLAWLNTLYFLQMYSYFLLMLSVTLCDISYISDKFALFNIEHELYGGLAILECARTPPANS